jgi:hypothetical protein
MDKLYLVLFETLFALTELLNMAVVRNFEVMLGQTLNHFNKDSSSLHLIG